MPVFGGYKVSVLVTERIRLDGGAMFGAVPRVLWEKHHVPDSKNRIELACRLMILSSGERKVLVDLGCGDKWTERERAIYGVKNLLNKPLRQVLTGVTDVILTHLHFDHAGGVSYLDEDASLKLSFPDAIHYIHPEHWEHAHRPGPRERASFREENLVPLQAAKLRFTQDGEEILPGISVFAANGHTKGLQWVRVGKGDKVLCFASELMPTTAHVPVPWVMGYDICAERTMEEKQHFAREAIAKKCLLVFGHDVKTTAGRLSLDDRGRFCVSETVELPEYGG